MGPFELLDVVGNDVSLAIERTLFLEFREPGFAPAPLLEHLVTAGYLGRKTGRGFRDYSTAVRLRRNGDEHGRSGSVELGAAGPAGGADAPHGRRARAGRPSSRCPWTVARSRRWSACTRCRPTAG